MQTSARHEDRTLYRGRVTCEGDPCADVDVLLLSTQWRAVAAVRCADDGTFEIPRPAAFDGGWIMARSRRGVIGARVVPAADTADLGDIAFRRSDALHFRGLVEIPAGVSPDGLEVHLTPRAVAGVSADLRVPLLLVGVGPNMAGTYLTQALDTATRAFAFDLLPGAWELRVERFREDAESLHETAPNLEAQAVVTGDGVAIAPRFGGFTLDLRHDTAVQVRIGIAAN